MHARERMMALPSGRSRHSTTPRRRGRIARRDAIPLSGRTAPAASDATATAGAQCEASAGAAISEANPRQGRPSRRATSAASVPDARGDDRRVDGDVAAGEAQEGGVGDVAHLRFREPGGEPLPFRRGGFVRFAADHAREARARGADGLLAPVGGRHWSAPSGKTSRMRWTSALLAKYSFIRGVQAPRNGARGASAMTKLRVIPV